MSGFLFQQIIFGPVQSRRLGRSLGVNLLPVSKKHCNYNCLYCECGFTSSQTNDLRLPSRTLIKQELEERLISFKEKGLDFDTITFAGNGEPTIHPDFPEIVDQTIFLRDKYFPDVKIAVLSNATTCHKPKIASSLHKVDQNILKLDAGTSSTFETINCPLGNFKFENLLENLRLFKGKMIIQTLFLKGKQDGQVIDNTTPEEIISWLSLLKELQPTLVMIYSVARGTPIEEIEIIPGEELQIIANKVKELGLKAEIY